jgi:integrase
MASIEKRGPGCYVIRWRTPEGKSRSKTVKREVDAKKYLVKVEHSKDVGAYIDPSRSKVKLGPFATDSWLATQAHLKTSTRARYENILSKHIVPRWGDTPLFAVGHADVQKWISSIDLAPASVRYVHRIFSLIMELAVRDERISSNPATGVKLPKIAEPGKRFLTVEEVHRLASAAAQYPIAEVGQQYRALVLTLAFCGLRWGEVAGLKVGRVNLLRRRLQIKETLIEVRGRLAWDTPKDHQDREVPIPRFLVDPLAELVAGKAADDLVFTTWRGRPLRNLNWRRDCFDRAARDAGLAELTPHELRHTAASLAVSAGANVKAVQRMLGHKSATMTLDVYADLFDKDLDGVADRMDSLPGVSKMCQDATVVELSTARNPL